MAVRVWAGPDFRHLNTYETAGAINCATVGCLNNVERKDMKKPMIMLVGIVLLTGALFAADGNTAPMKIQPRIVLCILHDSPDVVRSICARSRFFAFDEQYSNSGRDERMAKAFELSWDLVRPSATDGDKQGVEQHRNVAYVISRRLDSDGSMEVALDGLLRLA
jgi:hypothetical protein